LVVLNRSSSPSQKSNLPETDKRAAVMQVDGVLLTLPGTSRYRNSPEDFYPGIKLSGHKIVVIKLGC